jgi:adenosine deaminase
VVKGASHMKQIFEKLNENRVKYTINTDGPEMLMTNLRYEIDFLLANNILKRSEIIKANKTAFAASFIK